VEDVPEPWRFEVRLGLQEALVNAVKHGNGLDPGKRVCVHFSARSHRYWWMISDRGAGFKPPCCCHAPPLPPVAMDADLDDVTMDLDAVEDLLPGNEGECGRGLFILHQVFNRVEWQEDGRVLHLYKETDPIRISKRQRLAQAAQGLRASLRERYVAFVR
jgi:anti-sigma regulatory factor (Ser/Thr protein kinase)